MENKAKKKRGFGSLKKISCEIERITYSSWFLPPHSLFWCWNGRKWLGI